MRKPWCICLLLLLGAVAVPAKAASLYFDPPERTADLGEVVTVELWVSGLGGGVAPSLGGFGVDVVFDEQVLAFRQVAFGGYLGTGDTDPRFGFLTTPAESDIGVDSTVPGTLRLAEVSLLSDDQLENKQPAAFTLARLEFEMLALETTLIGLANPDLSDGLGNSLTAQLGSARIQPVPLPPSAMLLAGGLAGLAGIHRRRRRPCPRTCGAAGRYFVAAIPTCEGV